MRYKSWTLTDVDGSTPLNGVACTSTTSCLVIDGAVNGVASVVRVTGSKVRRLQTGYVRNYALGLAAGTVALLTYVFIVARVTG